MLFKTVTVDVVRFAGLNVRGFILIEVFVEILLCCFGQKYSLFSIIKERRIYSRKNFRGTLENREKCEVYKAQRIFPRLRYITKKLENEVTSNLKILHAFLFGP